MRISFVISELLDNGDEGFSADGFAFCDPLVKYRHDRDPGISYGRNPTVEFGQRGIQGFSP